EEKVIPGTNNEYYIENEKFTLETYDEDDPRFKDAIEKAGMVDKGYRTDLKISKVKDDAVVGSADELELIKDDYVEMNKPLKFKTMDFEVAEADDPNQEAIGEIEVDLQNPEKSYELDNGIRVQMDQYYPDYIIEDGEPATETKYPRNPAFVFSVYPPDSDEGE